MADDSELLLLYARECSEAAFAELVRRYLKLVYFAALRQVGGDAHRAEDVSQAVFTQLALKAATLTHRASIAGWLYTCTRYVSARVVRGDRRRRVREERLGAMIEATPDSSASTDWQHLGPVIDGALHKLNERDRELVLLRFFQDSSFVEISSKLGLSTDAARFRLNRALEKMRTALAKRGLKSTSAAIALALAAQARAAVPGEFASSFATVALAAREPATAATTASQILMSTTKMKPAVVAGVAVIGVLLVRDLRQEYQFRGLKHQFQSLQAAHEVLVTQARSQPPENIGVQLTSLRSKIIARQALAMSAPSSSIPALVPGMKSASALTNGGQSTPFASVETLLRALHTGNVDALAQMIALRPDARAAAQKLWASLPPESQARFPTPEAMLAPLAAEVFPSDFVGYNVTGDRQNGPTPDYWGVQFQYQKNDGTTVNTAASLQQINGTWMVFLNAQKLIDYLSGVGDMPQL